MIEKKLASYEAIGEDSIHHQMDTFYGLVAQHPDYTVIFPKGDELLGESCE